MEIRVLPTLKFPIYFFFQSMQNSEAYCIIFIVVLFCVDLLCDLIGWPFKDWLNWWVHFYLYYFSWSWDQISIFSILWIFCCFFGSLSVVSQMSASSPLFLWILVLLHLLYPFIFMETFFFFFLNEWPFPWWWHVYIDFENYFYIIYLATM